MCFILLSIQLLDTKSTDRKITLLHYIANVVKEKYAQVSLFYNELHYVEKAAAGESHSSDVCVVQFNCCVMRSCLTFYTSVWACMCTHTSARVHSVVGERPAGC